MKPDKDTNKDYDDYDEHNDDIIDFVAGILLTLVASIAVILLIGLLCSCSPKTVYIPAESTKIEYRNRDVTKYVADTITDTRVVFIKGDSVVSYRERDRIKRIEIHDTVKIETHDTVSAPYPIERRLSRWEQAKMDFGGGAISVCVIAVVCIAIWIVRKLSKA